MLRLALHREPPPRGGPDRGRPRWTGTAPTHWADQMTAIAEKDPKSLILVDRRHGAVGPADGRVVRRRVRPPPAGQEPGAGPAADVDRTAAVRGRPDDRAAGAVGEPAAGRRPGLDQQQHQQPEVPRGRRLARLRRGAKRAWSRTLREDPAGVYRPDGLRHARPVSPRRGDDGQAERRRRRARWPGARSTWRARPRHAAPPTPGPTHVGFYLVDKGLPRLERAVAARFSVAETRSARVPRAIRWRSISEASSSSTVLPTAALVVKLRAGRRGRLAPRGWSGSSCCSAPARWPSPSSTRWCPGWRRRAPCRRWTCRRAFPRPRGPWSSSRRSSRARRTWSTWSKRWRCASSATGTTTSAFGLLTDLADASQETLPGGRGPRASRRAADRRTEREVPRRSASSSSTARGAGTPRNASGWATSASAGSWPT